MATYQTYTAIGMREDLSDVIYSISPTDVPFMSSIGKTKATAVLHEWQTDSLAAASLSNFTVEGATASDATMSPTTRIGNRTQIAQKTIKISGTLQSVDKAGRKSEKSYQLAKASSEIKRDMETSLLSNQIAANGDSLFKRLMGFIGRSDLANDPDLARNDGRAKRAEEIDQIIGQWTQTQSIDQVLNALQEIAVPAGRIYTAKDIAEDPHYRARGVIETIESANGLKVEMPGIIPKLSNNPGAIRHRAPTLGEHTQKILQSIGLSEEQIKALKETGVLNQWKQRFKPCCIGLECPQWVYPQYLS